MIWHQWGSNCGHHMCYKTFLSAITDKSVMNIMLYTSEGIFVDHNVKWWNNTFQNSVWHTYILIKVVWITNSINFKTKGKPQGSVTIIARNDPNLYIYYCTKTTKCCPIHFRRVWQFHSICFHCRIYVGLYFARSLVIFSPQLLLF